MQELGSRALNTMEIARQCKNMMITHNIGQRPFAKYVMNQVVKVFFFYIRICFDTRFLFDIDDVIGDNSF